jgi:propionyl-CoA synthetase
MTTAHSRYHDVYARWKSDPVGFWEEAAREIDWIKPADRIFDRDAGPYGRWFVGALCNTCHNAVDRHVAARGEQAAILYDSPVTGTKQTLTYAQLQEAERMTFGLASSMRVASSFGAKPPKTTEWIAPIRAQASMPMAACGIIGM